MTNANTWLSKLRALLYEIPDNPEIRSIAMDYFVHHLSTDGDTVTIPRSQYRGTPTAVRLDQRQQVGMEAHGYLILTTPLGEERYPVHGGYMGNCRSYQWRHAPPCVYDDPGRWVYTALTVVDELPHLGDVVDPFLAAAGFTRTAQSLQVNRDEAERGSGASADALTRMIRATKSPASVDPK